MDFNGARRVSSAGYRLPERKNGPRPATTGPPAERTPRAKENVARAELDPDLSDTVKHDQAWKELVLSERRGVREWEKNWGFLRNYDHMGQLKPVEPSPDCVSLFSDRISNTANQAFGSRLSTPLGKELLRLDRLFLWPGSHHKHKQDPNMLPC